MPNAPARSARQPALIFIFITLFLDVLGIGLIVPILPKLVEQLAGGGVESASRYYGWLAALYGLMQFLCAPLLGSLSDRFGRRPVILASLLGSGLDLLLLAFAPNLAWFFVGRLIAGVTGANFSAATAYIADISPLRRGPHGQTFGQFRRQILQTVHCNIRTAIQKRGLQLLREKPLGQDRLAGLILRQRGRLQLVAGGFENLDVKINLRKRRAAIRHHRMRLRQCQRTAPGAKNDPL